MHCLLYIQSQQLLVHTSLHILMLLTLMSLQQAVICSLRLDFPRKQIGILLNFVQNLKPSMLNIIEYIQTPPMIIMIA